MKKAVKTEIVSVRLDRETKEWADACADAEDRPLSSWLARLIANERVRRPRKRVVREPAHV
jgi:Leu/Phe-tRNA-protein transferase